MFVTLLILGVPFAFLWALWVALVDFLPMIGGALAKHSHGAVRGSPIRSRRASSPWSVFLAYTQIENHVLNPVVMSRTVSVSPLLVLLAILIGVARQLARRTFGAFVAALIAIPPRAPSGGHP